MSFWSRIGDAFRANLAAAGSGTEVGNALKTIGDDLQNGIALLQGNTAGLENRPLEPGKASFGDEMRGVYADTVSKHGIIDDTTANQWHIAGHLSQGYDLSTPEGTMAATKNTVGGVFAPAINNPVTGPAMQKMAGYFEKGDRAGRAAMLYDSAAEKMGVNDYVLRDNAAVWKAAWEAADSGKIGVNAAALLFENAPGHDLTGANNPLMNPQAAADLKNKYAHTWWGVGAGVADSIMLGGIDPFKGAGRLAKGARAATRLSSPLRADPVAVRLNATTSAEEATTGLGRKVSDTARGAFGFSASVQGNTSELYKSMRATHDFESVDMFNHYGPMLAGTGQSNAATLLALMSRAQYIRDAHLQAVVKGNIVLAARGSQVARDYLIEHAPDLAAGLNRVSTAPAYFDHLDRLATKVASTPGYNMDAVKAAAERLDLDPMARRELRRYVDDIDNLQAHFDKLDSFSGLGGNAASAQNAAEIGMTALDRAKASIRHKTSFVYQPGSSGMTINVLRWSTRDRHMGFVNNAEPMVGVDQLTSALKETGLFDPLETRRLANAFINAGDQQVRQHLSEGIMEGMVNRLAREYNLTREEVNIIVADLSKARAKTTQYLSAAAADAAQSSRTVVFSDPGYLSRFAVDRALLETHIRDTTVIPPVDYIRDAIKVYKKEWDLGDSAGAARALADEKVQQMTDLWRFMLLGRPGLAVRALADTGLRTAAMIGAANTFLNVAHGLGDQSRRVWNPGAGPRVVDLDAAGRLRVKQMQDRANELRSQAAALPTGPKAAALIARADRLETQGIEMEMRGQTFAPHRESATKGTTVRLGGKDVTFRAYPDEAGLKGLEHAVLPGGHSLHESYAPAVMRRADRLVEDSENWSTAMPHLPFWGERYKRAMDALRTSYTGKRILAEADNPSTHDLIASLRDDARVRAEWQQVRDAHPNLRAWIEDMVNITTFHAPTSEIRQAILGSGLGSGSGRLTDKQIAHFFKDESGNGTGVDRMPVNGPEVALATGRDPVQLYAKVRANMYRTLLDKPDIHLIRMPLYKHQYKVHVQEQIRGMTRDEQRYATAEDIARIDSNARHRAIQDTRRVMVNTMRHTKAMESWRVVAPFLAPWQDAMESWGRLMYDNPKVIGQWVRYWQLPANAGLTVDQDGVVIPPWTDTASQGRNKFIKVGLPKGVQGFTGLEDIRLRQDSLNTIWQGEVPWVPGFGPAVAVPVGQVVGHLMPELGDSKNPLLRSLFPFGLPEGSDRAGSVGTQAVNQFVPAWFRALRTGLTEQAPEFGRAYGTALNGNIVDFREKNGGRNPTEAELVPLQAQARRAVRTAAIFKSGMLGIFGVSTTANVRGNFYVEQMHQLGAMEQQLHDQGRTVTEAFNLLFPEAADLDWSATQNETGINYTLKAQDAAKQHKALIDKNPEYGWFYVGSDNIIGPNNPYSPTANQLQKGDVYGPDELRRRVLTPTEWDRKVEVDLGWADYRKFATAAQTELERRGLHSMAQKGAADIAVLRKNLKAALAVKYPEWGKAQLQHPASAIERFEPVLAQALNDKSMKNRPDVRLIAQYMVLRQQTLDALKANKSRTADLNDPRNADVAEFLRQQGEILSRRNLGFQQAWQRLFSNEVEE